MAQPHLFEVYRGQEVGVHDDGGAVGVGPFYQSRRADGAHRHRFAHGLDLYAFDRRGEVLFELFGQIVDSGRHVGYAVFGEFGDVVVDNGARADLQQRLGAVEGQWSEAFAAASGHEDCRQRQKRRRRLHIEKP